MASNGDGANGVPGIKMDDREVDGDDRYFFATETEISNRLNTGYAAQGLPTPQSRPTDFEQIDYVAGERGGMNRIGSDVATGMPLNGTPASD